MRKNYWCSLSITPLMWVVRMLLHCNRIVKTTVTSSSTTTTVLSNWQTLPSLQTPSLETFSDLYHFIHTHICIHIHNHSSPFRITLCGQSHWSSSSGGGNSQTMSDTKDKSITMDYNAWFVHDLQSELGRRGLRKSGIKTDLISRLKYDDKIKSAAPSRQQSRYV